MEQLRALFIGAHADECEYGPGGLACLLHQKGVHTRFYNACALRKGWTPEQTQAERDTAPQAAAILGAEKAFEPDVALIWSCSEEHIDHILQEILTYKPHIVFLHYPQDTHSEHRELAKASYQALCLAPASGWHCKEIYAVEAGPDQTGQYMTPDIVINISSGRVTLRQSFHVFSCGSQLWQEKLTGAEFRGLKSNFDFGEAYKIIKYPDKGEDFLLRKVLPEQFAWFGNEYYPAHGDLYF